MYIIRGLQNIPSIYRGAVVTIGNFDGVHLGHQQLFYRLGAIGAEHGGAPVMAITFEPHPQRLLNPDKAPVRITNVRGKSRWMGIHGVDAMFILHFNRELAALDPQSFVKRILVDGLGVRQVLVGSNFRFGAKGVGSFQDLQLLGEKFGFGVHSESLFVANGDAVSSTRIRKAVGQGDFDLASDLLGRPFEIEKRVMGGKRRGRGLGFPTANFALDGLLHPPTGVYVVEGWIDDSWLPAVANIGHNPTFGDEGLHLEVHMLSNCGDIYRRVVRIRFLKRLREEVKFANVEALKTQIAKDVMAAKDYFAEKSVESTQ
ncbi:MAG: bifunctional riboflavin kinase/FAD synthetase [Magnetococcales bacterium]|nr:bifunctional riboflavin kinase/FAD synthetase [Magnetococcales bacterium]